MYSHTSIHHFHFSVPIVLLGIIGILACITGLSFGASAACGCGAAKAALTKETRKNAKKVEKCTFPLTEEDPCELEFKVTGAGEGWKFEKSEMRGEKWTERYQFVEKTCTAGTLYKNGEGCKNVIAVKSPRAEGTTNEYCMWFETEDGGEHGFGGCVKLEQ